MSLSVLYQPRRLLKPGRSLVGTACIPVPKLAFQCNATTDPRLLESHTRATCGTNPWGFGGQNQMRDYSMTGWDPVNYSKGLFADFVAGFQSRVDDHECDSK